MVDSRRAAKPARRRSGAVSAGGRRRRQPDRRRRAVKITLCALASCAVLAAGGVGYAYFSLNGNIKGVNVDAALGKNRPKNRDDGSMDILVLGSDSRAGANAKYGSGESGARSDTAMVVHVYPGHKKASVVSIPRDTLVDRPSCTDKGRTEPGADQVMFNTAYATGGPACAVKTVEHMSGVRMDHFLEVDFTGFKKIIDALGGVKITTTKPIDDEDSHLHLAPGTHTLGGEQALGLVRTRHGVPGGDGSDLGRIQLQQTFIKALMKQVKSGGLLSNPAKLYGVADTATKAVTTDTGLDSVSQLTGLAKSLGGIGAGDINMVTLPVTYDPNDAARVLPMTSADKEVWTALRHDKPIPKKAVKGSVGDKGGTSGYVK